jgi:hypothetical protein
MPRKPEFIIPPKGTSLKSQIYLRDPEKLPDEVKKALRAFLDEVKKARLNVNDVFGFTARPGAEEFCVCDAPNALCVLIAPTPPPGPDPCPLDFVDCVDLDPCPNLG